LKRSYSGLNILQEKIFGFTEPKGFIRHLFSNRKYITVVIPYYDYLRGKVFIDDLRDNFEDEIPLDLDIAFLLYMLYDDFLTQIKKGAKTEQIAAYLIDGKRKHFYKKVKQKRIMKPLTTHVFEFETIEEGYTEDDDEKKAYLAIRMRESEILRGEVLIHDLDIHLKGTDLSVEELIAIVYLDFIENVKKEGNSVKVQQSIVAHLKRF